MRILAPFLLLLVLQPMENAHAHRVNWPHFLKINPWTFEPDELRHPNPSMIAGLIALEEPGLSPNGRMFRAAQGITDLPGLTAEQRAVLLRDSLNLIHDHQHTWTAYDEGAEGGVIFFGGEIENQKRFALAVCLRTGQIYKGKIDCSSLMESSIVIDFANSSSWKPMAVKPSQTP